MNKKQKNNNKKTNQNKTKNKGEVNTRWVSKKYLLQIAVDCKQL